MSRLITWLTLCLLINPCLLGGPLVYTPLPMENPRSTLAANQPLISHLSQALEVEIEIRQLAGYQEILKEFSEGRIDFVYLGPLPFLALQEMTQDAVPLVAFREPDGDPSYTCTLASPFDAYPDMERIAGNASTLRLALTQPLSTCGYLASIWQLRQSGIAQERIHHTYLNSHEAVALALVRGEFDLGGLKTAIARRYQRLGVNTLTQSPRLPGFTLIANRRTLSDDLITRIRRELLAIPEQTLESLTLGRHGFAPVDGSAYQRVRDMLDELGLSPWQLPGE